MIYLFALLVSGAAALFLLCCWLGRTPSDFWSISIFEGRDLHSLAPHASVGDHPVLTAADVTDRRARFVADPFLWHDDSGWHMFLEVYDGATERGVIAHATSVDGAAWRYDRVVLEEPFHLSYPFVFEHAGELYMTPESGEARELRLYRALQFPHSWCLDTVLLEGRYYDPTLLQHDGHWWLWTCDEHFTPLLFFATTLRGPWLPHPSNARSRPDLHYGRPGGRMQVSEGAILRFVQDTVPTYGSCLHSRRVVALDVNQYAEVPSPDSPILQGTGTGWRATGMHQLDAWPGPQGGWIAAVDGNHQKPVYNWRAGARRLQQVMKSYRKHRRR